VGRKEKMNRPQPPPSLKEQIKKKRNPRRCWGSSGNRPLIKNGIGSLKKGEEKGGLGGEKRSITVVETREKDWTRENIFRTDQILSRKKLQRDTNIRKMGNRERGTSSAHTSRGQIGPSLRGKEGWGETRKWRRGSESKGFTTTEKHNHDQKDSLGGGGEGGKRNFRPEDGQRLTTKLNFIQGTMS